MSTERRRPAGRTRQHAGQRPRAGSPHQPPPEWARPNGGTRAHGGYRANDGGTRVNGEHRVAGRQPAPGGAGSGGRGGGRRPRRYAASKDPRPRWRRILSWKTLGLSALGMFLLGAIGMTVAFAMTPVPEANDFARSQATIVYWNDGETELGRFSAENREIVSIEDVPVHVRQAVIAAEDRTFYENSGFDPAGIARAAYNSLTSGEIRGGGSTITQQYVKNYYLTQEQTFTRKLKELFISVKLDQQQDKDEILQHYLNTIWFARGTYGVQTASKSYFDKPVSELDLEEGVGLAALIRNPNLYDPTLSEENADRFEQRFQYVLDGMVEAGAIDRAAADATEVPEVEPKKEGNQLGGPEGHLIQQVKKELLDAGLEEAEIETAGLRVVTTFDREKQQAAVEAVQEHFPKDEDGDPIEDLHAGMAAVVPGDGAVVAMYGGPDAVERSWNNALDAKLQPGSTMKPFALAAALENGVSLESRFHGDSPFDPEELGRPVRNQNDYSHGGPVDMVTATERSINTAYVDMTMQVGEGKVRDAIVRAGVPDESPGLDTNARITLGIASVSPTDMAEAYATLAAGGKQTDWYTVKRVTAPSGAVRHEVSPEPSQAIDDDVVADVTYALTQVVDGENGTGKAARDLNRPVAGKTGTHEDKTSWFAGYTPQLAATIMFYQGEGSTEEASLRGIVSGGTEDEPFPGGGVPAETWTAFMKAAHEDVPVVDFPPRADVGEAVNPTPTAEPTCPPGTEGTFPNCEAPEPTPDPTCPAGTEGTFPDCTPIETTPTPTEDPEADVPGVIDEWQEQARRILRRAGFDVAVEPQVTEDAPEGRVIDQRPGPGSSAEPGSTVTIVVAVAPDDDEPDPDPDPSPTCVPPECNNGEGNGNS